MSQTTDENNDPHGQRTTCSFIVGGMDCPSCENTVRSAVEKMPGVQTVKTNYMEMRLDIEGNGKDFNVDKIKSTIRSIGYQPQEHHKTKRTMLSVPALDNPEAENNLRSILRKLSVYVLNADFASQTLTVSHEISRKQLLEYFVKNGYPARLIDEESASEQKRKYLHAILIAIASTALVTGVVLEFNGFADYITIPIFAISILFGGIRIFQKGLQGMLRKALDMNGLMTLSVIGAMIIGEWMEGATVILLGALAAFLEGWSMDRARNAVKKLMALTPQTALLRLDGIEEETPLEEVNIGDTMVVKPGSRVPLDGEVTSGESTVDQSPITGESLPLLKKPGDSLFAGSINNEGTILVNVTKKVEDSTVSRIIHMVQEAQARRSGTERFIDRFARIYTPTAVLIAVLIATFPPLFMGDWSTWFYRALVLLVIACPCALVISTPVGIVSGLTAAARSGVLIKGGEFLELSANIDVVAFDKTGTLTQGSLGVQDVITMNGMEPEAMLKLAASLERYSEHPISEAIVNEAKRRTVALLEPVDVKSFPGKGIQGSVDGNIIRVGSVRMLEELNIISATNTGEVSQRQVPGYTNVCISRNDELLGIITLSDGIRPEAPAALAELAALGLSNVVMLSGDSDNAVKSIADSLSLRDIHSSLLPRDKLEILEKYRSEGKKVMMVGDGINDAPALATADVGVAMAAGGTDIAMETADIALMSDDVRNIPFLIRHSRKTMALIRQNIVISIGTKALFVALSIMGFASLWMAVLADTGLSLLVTANSLRLLKR